MKLLKKLAAICLVCIMAFSLTACHQKDEIAVTINGYEFTSAYYMCAFMNAYLEGQQLVSLELSEEEAMEEINYSKQKIEGKKFEDWVKDTAIDNLKKNALNKKLCDEKEIKVTDELRSSNEYYASMYWSSYGYSELFEPNGVSFATFTQYMLDESLSTLYFENIYGEKGEKEIPAKDVKSKLHKDFVIADVLEYTHSESSKEDLKAITKKFKDYAEKLEKGEKTFEEVYNEYNKIEEKEEEHDDHEGHDHEEVKEPKDALASIIGAEGTGYDKDYFKDVKAMKTGDIKVIEKKDNGGCLLVVKQDIKADDYYLDTMDMTIRHLLKDAEFEKMIDEEYKKLNAEINDFAVKQFKVKKIKEPEYTY